jgi:hypothetical protein
VELGLSDATVRSRQVCSIKYRSTNDIDSSMHRNVSVCAGHVVVKGYYYKKL